MAHERPLSVRSLFALSLGLLLGVDAHAGFWVGHPVPELAPAGEPLTWSEATLPTAGLELKDCGDDTAWVEIDADLDLLDADPITLPAGTWCEATLVLDGPLNLLATRAGGGDVDIQLTVDEIPLSLPGDVTVDGAVTGSQIVLFDVDWFEDAFGSSPTTADVIVSYGDPAHGALVGALEADSKLAP